MQEKPSDESFSLNEYRKPQQCDCGHIEQNMIAVCVAPPNRLVYESLDCFMYQGVSSRQKNHE